MSIKHYDLNLLRIAPENVRTDRKSKSYKASLDEMVASIVEIGLLQNLIGYVDTDSNVKICAGGTRLEAIKMLVASLKLPDSIDMTRIPVHILSQSEALTASLNENSFRTDMSAVDKYKAYKKLYDTGTSEADIARLYYIEANDVKRILALMSLPKAIFKALEDGKMTVDVARAFASTNDTKRQLRIFKDIKSNLSNIYASDVKTALNEDTYYLTDDVVKFIGMKAYQDAGGKTEDDLFEETTRLLNGDIVAELFNAKLTAKTEKFKADGWANTELVEYDYNLSERLKKKYGPKLFKAFIGTKAQKASLKKLDKAREFNWEATAAQKKAIKKADTKYNALYAKTHDFTEAQKQNAIVITCWAYGSFKTYILNTKKEKTAALKKADDPANLSKTLKSSMGTLAGSALTAHMVENPSKAALSLMLASMISGIYCIDVKVGYSRNANYEGITTPKYKRPNKAEQSNGAEAFKTIYKMTDDQRAMLCADILAQGVNFNMINETNSVLFKTVAKTIGLDITDRWTPDEEFFNRMNGKQLRHAMSEMGMDITPYEKAKKKDLAGAAFRQSVKKKWVPMDIRTNIVKKRTLKKPSVRKTKAYNAKTQAVATKKEETLPSPQAKAS
ncbi:MAG: hypothetical protein COA43_00575 [Robiginitomaculum sp.]|nr:MAG: hypothetical protein COA43_00575 [Robiginitomaculum sp.]